MVGSRSSVRWVLAGLVAMGAVFLVGCTPSHPQSTFDAQGPVAQRQLEMFVILIWVSAFVFVTVGGALLYAVIRFRRRRAGDLPRQIHGNKKLEIAWTLAAVGVLAFIAVPTVSLAFYVDNPPEAEALDIRVVAHQWWWEFHYPELDLVTSNELHIPVGKQINLTLESEDVIHSFWVPKLAGKMDIIPGRQNEMWLMAETAGTFFGQCAEFCGIAHANMRFRVIAQPEEEFVGWVNDQREVPEAPTGLAKRGAEVFISKGCLACHAIDGTIARGTLGPDLTYVGSRTTLAGGILDNDPGGTNLGRWLRDPEEIKPGNIMSRQAAVYRDLSLALEEEEIGALVAYLQSLK